MQKEEKKKFTEKPGRDFRYKFPFAIFNVVEECGTMMCEECRKATEAAREKKRKALGKRKPGRPPKARAQAQGMGRAA